MKIEVIKPNIKINTRTECLPRIIKNIKIKEKTGFASKFGFYRKINHLSIIRLDNEGGIIKINKIKMECIYLH